MNNITGMFETHSTRNAILEGKRPRSVFPLQNTIPKGPLLASAVVNVWAK